MRLVKTCLAVMASLLLASSARAQAPVYDLERLQLDPTARGSLVIGDGEVGPQWATRFSLAAHWEHQPLAYLPGEGIFRGRGVGTSGTATNVVKDRLTFHLGAAVAIFDSLELYLRVPYVADQKSDFPSPPLANYQPKKSGLGTPSGGLRWGFASQRDGAPVSAAFAGEFLPSWGAKDAVTSSPKVSNTFAARFELGRRLSGVVLGGELFGLFREADVQLGGDKLKAEFGGGVMVATTGKLRGEISVRGTVLQGDLGRHLEALAGLRYVAGPVDIFALGGPGFGAAPGTPQWRGLVGLAFGTDGKKPPPPPPPDPCAPGAVHTPEQCPNLDDDGDGIPNKDDACPTVAGIAELQGCPAKDTDGDGIPDHLDKCPDEPGIPELQGCPAKDRDGDGIPDHLDKCPDVPGTAEYNGCPPPKAVIKEDRIDVKETVYFDTGKAVIQARSYGLLDEVAQILKDNPQVAKVVVEGHTDSVGKAATNRKLSQARADSVKAYLVGKGVDAGRLDTQGYGPDRPVASNKTKEGREKNRRVDFVISNVKK